MATLGVGTVLQALFPPFARIWEISKPEAKAAGDATETWVESRPADQQPIKLLKALPTLTLLGTFAVIFAPRIRATVIAAIAARKPKGTAIAQWIPQEANVANGAAAARDPEIIPPPGAEATIAGGGYRGEVADSFSGIDGSDLEQPG